VSFNASGNHAAQLKPERLLSNVIKPRSLVVHFHLTKSLAALVLLLSLTNSCAVGPSTASQSSTMAAEAVVKANVETVRYGTDTNYNAMDVYGVVPGASRPVIVFVHGGGWIQGDKIDGAGNKPNFYTEKGFVLATPNYRLRPDSQVGDAAKDIAQAIAYLRANARRLGIDPDQIIIQGHSSGAHLSALVALDARYFAAAGIPASSIKAVSLLDGAGYDVPLQIATGGNSLLYRTVFGLDGAVQAQLSPITYARLARNPPPFIIHYVADRDASRLQSTNLAEALRARGGVAEVYAAAGKTHATLNREFGLASDVPTQEFMTFTATRVRRGTAMALQPGMQPERTDQSESIQNRVRRVCAPDAPRLCPNTRGREVLTCLIEKSSQTAPICAETLSFFTAAREQAASEATEVRAAPPIADRAQAIRSACSDDAAHLCPGKAGGQALQCLRLAAASVSQTCRSAIAR
jgi:arylformamidase